MAPRLARPLVFAALLVALLAALCARAASAQSPFRSTVTFGDSMTCNWPLSVLFHGPDNLWGADPAEAVFLKAAAAGDQITDYSALAARASEVRGEFYSYVDHCLTGQQTPGTFFFWQAGTNEFLNNQAAFRSQPPGQNATTDRILDTYLRDAFDQIYLLVLCHPGARIAVWTIPDVTLLPIWWGQISLQDMANLRAHLQRANDVLRALEWFPQVAVVDFDAVWRATIAAPPAVGGRALLGPPAWGQGTDLFAEPFHPTAVFNALIANGFIATLNARFGLTIPSYTQAELLAMTYAP